MWQGQGQPLESPCGPRRCRKPVPTCACHPELMADGFHKWGYSKIIKKMHIQKKTGTSKWQKTYHIGVILRKENFGGPVRPRSSVFVGLLLSLPSLPQRFRLDIFRRHGWTLGASMAKNLRVDLDLSIWSSSSGLVVSWIWLLGLFFVNLVTWMANNVWVESGFA